MKNDKSQVEMEVTFLTDPTARYVSLVKRGANQTPFRVVKTCKEEGTMRVLQSIIARKGTDAEVIKKALGEDVADIVQLNSPQETGSFTSYEQHPRDVFKADSFEVVDLAGDKSVLGIQGELIEKSEGIVAKLIKPAQKPVISVAEGAEVLSQEVVKADLGSEMWSELNAIEQAVRGIISQKEGSSRDKLTMVRTVLDNFMASLELAVTVAKCDSFDLPAEQVEKSETAELAQEQAAEASADPEPEQAEKAESAEAAEAAAEPEAQPSLEETVQKALKDAAEASLKQLETALKSQAEKFETELKKLTDEVDHLKKAPATVVKSHADDGVVGKDAIKKGETGVFQGVFGNLGRR